MTNEKYKKINELNEFDIIQNKYKMIDYNEINEESWNFSGFNLEKHLKEKKLKFFPLTKYAVPLTGILTGLDKVFVLNEEQVEEFKIEKDILIPYASKGKEVKRFKNTITNSYIIYPYKLREDGSKFLIGENQLKNEFPNTYNYLYTNKVELMNRKDSRKLYALEEWYKLVRSGDYTMIKPQKLLFKGIGKNIECGLLSENMAFNGANCPGIIPIDEKYTYYLLALLNSDVINNYLNAIVPKKLDGYHRYNTTSLKKIPIIIADEIEFNQIENISREIVILSQQQDKINSIFLNRMTSNFNVSSFGRNVHVSSLSNVEFVKKIKEKNKRISLNEQDELEGYFENFKKKYNNFTVELNVLNKELNTLINNLYSI